MEPTRQSQPYRRGAREPGPPLDAMRKGAPAHLPNPQDLVRQASVSRKPLRHTRSLFLDGLARRRKLGI